MQLQCELLLVTGLFVDIVLMGETSTSFKIGILAEPDISDIVIHVVDYMVKESSMLSNASYEIVRFDSTNLSDDMDYVRTACQLASEDLAALVTSISSGGIHHLQPIFSSQHSTIISSVATDPDLSLPGRSQYLIKMSSPDTIQGRALADLIDHYGWSRLAIMQENTNYGIHGLQEFLRIALVKRWTVTSMITFAVPGKTEKLDVDEELLSIKTSGARVILLHSQAKWAWQILEAASSLNMFTIGWAWVVTDGVTLSELPVPPARQQQAPQADFIPSPFQECHALRDSAFVGLLGTQPSVGQGKYANLMGDIITKQLMQSGSQRNSSSVMHERLFCQDISANGYAMRLLDALWLTVNALDDFLSANNTWSARLSSQNAICDRQDVTPWLDGEIFFDILHQSEIEGTMNFINSTDINTPGIVSYSIVNLKEEGWVEIGEWVDNEGLSMSCVEIFPGLTSTPPKDQDASLDKAHLDIVTIIEEPFVMYNDRYPDTSDEELVGLCLDLIKALQFRLNFKYTVHLSKDGFYGARDPKTDTWNGMLKELQYFEADVSISALFITEERLHVFDMTKPYMDLGLDVLIAKEGVDGSPFNFFRPFDSALWLAILGCNVACGFLVCSCSYLSPYGYRGRYIQRRDINNQKFRADRGELSFNNSLWHSFVSILTQGSNINAISTSGRIVAAFWFALCSILLAAYTADLTAYLTVERMYSGIQTMMDLANQQDIKYGTLEGTAIQSFFAENGADPFPRMYKFMKIRETFVDNASVGLDMVQDSFGIPKGHPGKFALIYDSTVLEYMSRNEPCVTRTLGDIFRKMGYGLALRKNSPYTQAFNEAIMHLREAGIIEELSKKWINGPCPDPKAESESGTAQQLTLQRMNGVFVLFFGGAATACGVLILEFMTACYTDVITDRVHKVKDTSFCQHMSRRFKDIAADIRLILTAAAISCGLYRPSEQTREKVRGKWLSTRDVNMFPNGIKLGQIKGTQELCNANSPPMVNGGSVFKSSEGNNQIAAPIVSSSSAFLDLYRKNKNNAEESSEPQFHENGHLGNSDIMLY